MRADAWGTVAAYAAALAGAVTSRLHAYWPAERRRRAAQDAETIQQYRDAVAQALADDDAEQVERWVDFNGFTQQAQAHGFDEATEVRLTSATNAYRERLRDILQTDGFDLHLMIGLDKEGEDA